MPTVLPSVEKGLLGRGRWDKPLPAREPQDRWLTEAQRMLTQTKLIKGRVKEASSGGVWVKSPEEPTVLCKFECKVAKSDVLQGREDRAAVQP